MSSGTPPAGSTGLPGRHTRPIGTGLRATGRGLGFGALSLTGAGLLMALAAPLLLALPVLVTAATVVRRTHGAARAVRRRQTGACWPCSPTCQPSSPRPPDECQTRLRACQA